MKKFILFLAVFFYFGSAALPVAEAATSFDLGGIIQDAADRWGQNVEDSADKWLDEKFGEGSMGPIPDGHFLLPCPQDFNELGQVTSARKYIVNVLNFVLSFLGLIAVAAVIYAGILYVTAGGDDGQTGKAKKIILYAVIGILIVLISFALVNTIIQNAATGGDDRGGGSSVTINGQSYSAVDFEPGGKYAHCVSADLGDLNKGKGRIVLTSPAVNFGKGWLVRPGDKVSFGLQDVGSHEMDDSKQGVWDFGDGALVQKPLGNKDAWPYYAADYTFSAQGWTVVRLTAAQLKWGVLGLKQDVKVDVQYQVPVFVGYGAEARFDYFPENPKVDEMVGFDASMSSASLGSIAGYEWKCEVVSGNGPCPTLSSGKAIKAKFPSDGEYRITLTLITTTGEKVSAEAVIKVSGGNKSCPGCKIIGPTSITAGQTASFSTEVGFDDYSWVFKSDPISVGTGAKTFVQTEKKDSNVFLIDQQKMSNQIAPGSHTITVTMKSEDRGEFTASLDLQLLKSANDVYNGTGMCPQKPVAAFVTYGNVEANGMPVFSARSGEGVTYKWEFGSKLGDATKKPTPETGTDRDQVVSFPEEGQYRVKLTLTTEQTDDCKDALSTTTEQLISVAKSSIAGEPPLGADFSAPQQVYAGDIVSFLGIYHPKYKDAVDIEWDFPDGTTDKFAATTYVFSLPDENTKQEKQVVKFKIKKKADKDWTTVEKQILVKEPSASHMPSSLEGGRPKAIPKIFVDGAEEFPPTIDMFRGESVSFSSDSLDESGEQGTSDTLSETWAVNEQAIPSAGQIPSRLANIGSYMVKLSVASKKNSNLRDSNVLRVTVKNNPPVIQSLQVKPASDNTSVKVNVSASDKDGSIKDYRYELLEFGQSVASQVSTKTEATFPLNSLAKGAHTLTVKVTATDNEGAKADKESNTFSIEKGDDANSKFGNHTPKVSILVTPSNQGTTLTTFTFMAQGVDEDNDFLTYTWTFPGGEQKVGQTVNYRFTKPGLHNVEVEASDGTAKQQSAIQVSVVADPNDTGDFKGTAATAQIACILPGNTGNVDTIFSFYSNISEETNDLAYLWDFGDGKQMHLRNVSYQFSKPGLYKVKFKVSDGVNQLEDEAQIIVVGKDEAVPQNTFECKKGMEDLPSTLTQEQIGIFSMSSDGSDEFKHITISGNTNTTFFLYGNGPKESARPLFYSWDFGDANQKAIGQNVQIRYPKEGVYKVLMNVSDGINTLSDSLQIEVLSEKTVSACAGEGQEYSGVYLDKYPAVCCAGLTAWPRGMDTRRVVGGQCIETGLVSGNPVGVCINCGNKTCDALENICNCPQDCPL